MKALIFSAYYEPEIAASLYLSTNLYEDMASSGIDVSLFVPTPTRGVSALERKKYSKEKRIEQKCNGRLVIHRVSLPREGKNIFFRAMRYLLLNLAFFIKSIYEKPDFIFVQSTPPTQGVMAAIIKRFKKVPLVYNLQDIFPDSLVGAGITIEGSALYRIGRKLENFTYKNCDCIIVISEDMKNNIIKKGVPEEKVKVISNWVNSDSVYPVEKKNNYLFEKFQIDPSKFIVLYAGNLGYAQNIEVILHAAEMLKDNNGIQFVIFGKGNQEEEYKKIATSLNLDNICFFPIQPYSEVSFVYSLGDVSVVSCKKGFGGSAMPSKTWNIMATGTPILASFDRNTEMEKIVQDYKVGLFAEAENEKEFCANIVKLYKNRDLLTSFGVNARNYVENNLDRNVCTNQYIETIMEMLLCRK